MVQEKDSAGFKNIEITVKPVFDGKQIATQAFINLIRKVAKEKSEDVDFIPLR